MMMMVHPAICPKKKLMPMSNFMNGSYYKARVFFSFAFFPPQAVGEKREPASRHPCHVDQKGTTTQNQSKHIFSVAEAFLHLNRCEQEKKIQHSISVETRQENQVRPKILYTLSRRPADPSLSLFFVSQGDRQTDRQTTGQQAGTIFTRIPNPPPMRAPWVMPPVAQRSSVVALLLQIPPHICLRDSLRASIS